MRYRIMYMEDEDFCSAGCDCYEENRCLLLWKHQLIRLDECKNTKFKKDREGLYVHI